METVEALIGKVPELDDIKAKFVDINIMINDKL